MTYRFKFPSPEMPLIHAGGWLLFTHYLLLHKYANVTAEACTWSFSSLDMVPKRVHAAGDGKLLYI